MPSGKTRAKRVNPFRATWIGFWVVIGCGLVLTLVVMLLWEGITALIGVVQDYPRHAALAAVALAVILPVSYFVGRSIIENEPERPKLEPGGPRYE